jgi:hypothetical protein
MPIRRRPRRQKSTIKTNLQLAEVLFDPDEEARRASMIACALNDYSQRERSGITFRSTMRGIDVYETFGGAAKLVETNDMGPLGSFLRWLNRGGWFSARPKVIEKLKARANLQRNEQIAASKVALDRDEEDRARLIEWNRMCSSVERGDAWLDNAIRPLSEHRGVFLGPSKVFPLEYGLDGVPKVAPLRPRARKVVKK